MSTYVKKEDGTLIESDTEVVKVESNSLKKLLDITKTFTHFGVSTIPNREIHISKILQYSDTENVVNMRYGFSTSYSDYNNYNKKYYYPKLRSLILLNTSNVVDMSYMFYGVTLDSGTLPLYDTSKVTDMSYMFAHLTARNNLNPPTIPKYNTSNVTNMSYMFAGCSSKSCILPNPFFDTSNVVNMSYMFSTYIPLEGYYNNGYSEIPIFNTTKVTNISYMFYHNSELLIIPAFDFSNVTDANAAFGNCKNLEQFLPTGLKVSFYLSDSTKLTREALVVVLNNLGTPTSTQTLTLGSTNLAKLTEEDIAIATEKNWTLQ